MTPDQLIKLIAEELTLEQINADPRTVCRIPLSRLAGDILYPTGLLTQDAAGVWHGGLIDAMANDAYPAEFRAGLGRFLAPLRDPRIVHLDTTQRAIAQMVADVLGGCVSFGLLTADQYAAIYAMASGKLVAEPVTEEAYHAAKVIADGLEADAARRATIAAVKEESQKKLNAIEASFQEYVKNLEQWDGNGNAPAAWANS